MYQFWRCLFAGPNLEQKVSQGAFCVLKSLVYLDRLISTSGSDINALVSFIEKCHTINVTVVGGIDDVGSWNVEVLPRRRRRSFRTYRIGATTAGNSGWGPVPGVNICRLPLVLRITVEELVCLS